MAVMRPKAAGKVGKYDHCQTPAYAVAPLLPYLKPFASIWEPASGDGLLVAALELGLDVRRAGIRIIYSDLEHGGDFFDLQPDDRPDQPIGCIVTNPPFSIKYRWIERCYELGRPWALLMPIETLGAKRAQRLFKQHGMELLVLSRRIDFIMPDPDQDSCPFPVAWFTWKLNLGASIVYGEVPR